MSTKRGPSNSYHELVSRKIYIQQKEASVGEKYFYYFKIFNSELEKTTFNLS